MKAKGLVLLVAAMLMVAVVLVGCKKKEQPAPPKAAVTKDVQKEADKVAKESQEAIKKVDAEAKQTTCPVMDGNKINPDVFVEYKGVKVYFCCSSCKAKFEADPEKYTANLPQFKK